MEAAQLGLAIPSRPTLYRALDNLAGSRHPFGHVTTRRTQANRPDRPWGRQSPSRPGETRRSRRQHTAGSDGGVPERLDTGRVDLTAALDIATRTPCAAILRPVATKSVDAAVLLARALTPLPMQPGWQREKAREA